MASSNSACFSFSQAAFEDEEGSQYFDSEDVFQQLNYECNDFGDDSGSDRDDDVVGLSLNCLCFVLLNSFITNTAKLQCRVTKIKINCVIDLYVYT